MAAHLFANVLDWISANDWDRTAVYNDPRQSERSLRWVAVHTAHEVSRHSLDIRRQLTSDTSRNRLRAVSTDRPRWVIRLVLAGTIRTDAGTDVEDGDRVRAVVDFV